MYENIKIEWEMGELAQRMGYMSDYFITGVDKQGNEYEAIGSGYPDDSEIYEVKDIELVKSIKV